MLQRIGGSGAPVRGGKSTEIEGGRKKKGFPQFPLSSVLFGGGFGVLFWVVGILVFVLGGWVMLGGGAQRVLFGAQKER